jgi:hypothetical protein
MVPPSGVDTLPCTLMQYIGSTSAILEGSDSDVQATLQRLLDATESGDYISNANAVLTVKIMRTRESAVQ